MVYSPRRHHRRNRPAKILPSSHPLSPKLARPCISAPSCPSILFFFFPSLMIPSSALSERVRSIVIQIEKKRRILSYRYHHRTSCTHLLPHAVGIAPLFASCAPAPRSPCTTKVLPRRHTTRCGIDRRRRMVTCSLQATRCLSPIPPNPPTSATAGDPPAPPTAGRNRRSLRESRQRSRHGPNVPTEGTVATSNASIAAVKLCGSKQALSGLRSSGWDMADVQD